MSASPYKQLEQEFRRLHAFRGALALLRWDAAVMMPRGSADVRGEQLAALETEHHALLTAPRIIRLLDRAQANTQGLEDWQIANLHEMRRQRDHAIATPATLVSRLTKAASRAESRWLEARAQGKFEAFAPYLEEVVHLVRDKAALLGQALNLAPYDALVDEFSPGLTTADIDAMFKALSRRLSSLIREVIAEQEVRPALPLTGKFPPAKQRAVRALHPTAAGEALRHERTGVGRGEHLRPPHPGAARTDPRGCGRAHLPAAHHAALRAGEAAARRGAGGARPARSLERRDGGAARHPPGERCGGVPAGHSLGGRLLRILPLLRARGGHRRAALREPAGRRTGARRAARARGILGVLRLAAHERARARRQGAGAGVAARRDRQAPLGDFLHALRRGKVPRDCREQQRRGLTRRLARSSPAA